MATRAGRHLRTTEKAMRAHLHSGQQRPDFHPHRAVMRPPFPPRGGIGSAFTAQTPQGTLPEMSLEAMMATRSPPSKAASSEESPALPTVLRSPLPLISKPSGLPGRPSSCSNDEVTPHNPHRNSIKGGKGRCLIAHVPKCSGFNRSLYQDPGKSQPG